jgi:uncharacterized protein YuzE
MDEKQLKISYDPKADVLYCSIGEPVEAIGMETGEDDVIVRLNPETDEVVGVTVLNFANRFQSKETGPVSIPIGRIFADAHSPQVR